MTKVKVTEYAEGNFRFGFGTKLYLARNELINK